MPAAKKLMARNPDHGVLHVEADACHVCKHDCTECGAHCKRTGWCDDCMSEGLVANFNRWTSGDIKIDTFIQKTQTEAMSYRAYLEWIDPQNITDISHIADGGFGSVYQATWKNAPSRVYRTKVALKTINSDQNIFLNEVL